MARKRKPRRSPPPDLKDWSTILIWERVPLRCLECDPDIKEKAYALGAEFARTHAHLSAEDPQLLNILDVLLPWVRARGYPVLDDPLCPYATCTPESLEVSGAPLFKPALQKRRASNPEFR